MEAGEQDVRGISEITILPDGRLCVLGLSASVWEMLDAAGPWDELERGPRRCENRDAAEREPPR
jgi:hypothetical protein